MRFWGAGAGPTGEETAAMYTGILWVDLVLGDVRSLKQKRAIVRPLIADVRRRFEVAVAETGDADLHRRAELGVAAVAGAAGRCQEVLDAVERFVAERPEIEVLQTRRRLFSVDD